MPYYEKLNILFIHIPKTGGTVCEGALSKYSNQRLYSGYTNSLLPSPYNKTSLQHQFYTTIYNFQEKLNVNFKNIKIFAVVRNPYDRVISDLFWYRLINRNTDTEQVYNVIKNNYLRRDDLDNHNEPQYKFITDSNSKLIPDIKIFKTEKLNEDNDKINKFLGIDINIKRNNVNKDYSRYLNKKSISLINEFYKKDFKLFNYEMK
jgi:hypothetical protein